MERSLRQQPKYTRSIFIANAHTLNLAMEDPQYCYVLNKATLVFGDGIGFRWAASLRGAIVKSNLAGTDLIPEFLLATANRGYRYFLLGADPVSIVRAAQTASEKFPGWEMVGFNHGFFSVDETESIIRKINLARPHLLLVAMGNPLQERWIYTHQHQLKVPLCVGVGGLLDYWADNLKRAPLWMRKLGLEWLNILWQQPYKWRRYIIGNPKFLLRIVTIAN